MKLTNKKTNGGWGRVYQYQLFGAILKATTLLCLTVFLKEAL